MPTRTDARSDNAPLTAEQAFCRAAAAVLSPRQLEGILFEMRCLAYRISNTHDLDNLTVALRLSGARPASLGNTMSSITDVLSDAAVRDRVKRFLVQAHAADPVDTLADAELIHRLMQERLDAVFPGAHN